MARTLRRGAAPLVAGLLVLAGCAGVDLPDPPPVPTGPTHTLPAPSAYPDLRITGASACDLLSPQRRAEFSLGAPTEGDETVCFYPGAGARKGPASDTVVFLTANSTLADWGAEQQDFTRWTTVTTDGTTGVMSAGAVECHGAFAITPDAILEVLVDPEQEEPLCARATEIMKAALAGLRAQQ